jgi:succinate dehydrogenase/fumarate reductase flavoprotein subunit
LPSCASATRRWCCTDKSNVFNTDLFQVLELGSMLDCASALTVGALARKESRGAHQRLDYVERDDNKLSCATAWPTTRVWICRGWTIWML